MRKQLFNSPAETPSMTAAMQRIGDGGGLRPARRDTMSLSTPIVSVQDGPRIMGTSHFGGKTAAPFVKGGGRSKKHPNDAKGKKRAAAKAALSKAKGGDYSNLDLAFWDREKRNLHGEWTDQTGHSGRTGDGYLMTIGEKVGKLHPEQQAVYRKHQQKGATNKVAFAKALAHKPKDRSGGNKALADIQRRARLDTSNQQDGSIDLGFAPSEPRGTDGRWIRAAMRASTQRERNSVRVGHMGDYQNHATSHDEHRKVLDILDAADAAAKGQGGDKSFASIREPSKPEAQFLAAKNKLAQANLSGKPRKIAKAQKAVAKAGLLMAQSRNAASAVAVAGKVYGSAAHVAATDGSSNTRL
jgi:hypothetical protein